MSFSAAELLRANDLRAPESPGVTADSGAFCVAVSSGKRASFFSTVFPPPPNLEFQGENPESYI